MICGGLRRHGTPQVCNRLSSELTAFRIDFRSSLNRRHALGDVGYPLIYVCLLSSSRYTTGFL